jgi:hypothetical protein
VARAVRGFTGTASAPARGFPVAAGAGPPQRQRARLAPWDEVFRDADCLRHLDQVTAAARALATRLGPDSDEAWTLLAEAADLATAARALEAGLDAELAAR